MADQEFRDRCARAMGWKPNTSKNPLQAGTFWQDTDGDWVEPMSSWAPDEDYNQAMMMRNECWDKGLRSEYAAALVSHGDGMHVVWATARQIAEAALRVLEAKEASSARTQEDK